MATMITGSELPSEASSAAASAMPGNAMSMSMMRMMVSLAHLALVAASAPSRPPMTRARATEPMPISSEERAPKSRREKMSRPSRSVPKRFSALGGRAGMPEASGSCGASTGARIAAREISTRKARAIFEPSGSAVKRVVPELRRATRPFRGARVAMKSYTVLMRGLMSR